MKKYDIEVQETSKTKFKEEYMKIKEFLKNNFTAEERASRDGATIHTTTDRSKVLQLIQGLKNLSWYQYDSEAYELTNSGWKNDKCIEDNQMEEIKAISFCAKAITYSKKMMMAAYVTIAKDEDVYIICTDYTNYFKNKGYCFTAKEIKRYKHDFTGSFLAAAAWCNTVRTLRSKVFRSRREARLERERRAE